ncbi:hypothetical protein [Halalkalicoccus sp. NIPERK01]|uniref:DUF7546 family protein n=1 Tax=Halalkalicoccus sp. NIPERK01 TaxID=3053469 RepID=UPI00256F28ED|nr:hypothetical protein [Halalkalicoccus sp. NIPERK01]MDL5361071.1 hypothetical protein [Halalkalicoccus sp. NIPERK01]
MALTANRRSNAVPSGDVRLLGAVVAVEGLLVAAYFGLTPAEPTGLRYVLYPFVWIDVGLWAVLRTAPPTGSRRARWLALGVAAAYFLALAGVSGLIGVQVGHAHHVHAAGIHVRMGAPGWGPAVSYVSSTVHLTFVPYLVIGYLSLAYLVYAAVIEAVGAAVPGVIGLASCVGCAFPAVAGVAGVAGGSSVLTAAASSLSVDVSTAAFVLAIALLYWRPGFRSP